MDQKRRDFIVSVAALGAGAVARPALGWAAQQSLEARFLNVMAMYMPGTRIDKADLDQLIMDYAAAQDAGWGKSADANLPEDFEQQRTDYEIMRWVLLGTDFFDRTSPDQPVRFVRSLILQEGACINPLARFDDAD